MLSNLFYRNSRLTVLAVGLILVAGVSALQSLSRQEDPTIARRYATITTFYPGASALRVESLVTDKIESELLELHEVRQIDSTSRTGVSVIKVELEDQYGEEDVDEVWSKARDRLSEVEPKLPPGALPPAFEDRTTTAATLIAALVWVQDERPQIDILTRLAEELENRLRNIPNTKETKLYGEAEEEIRVTIDPVALVSVGLTAAGVSSAIVRADAKIPAGQLRHAGNDLLIEVTGELDSIERIRRVPLVQAEGGSVTRVGDVAHVEKTSREPPSTLALIGGRPGVAVAVTMEPDHRVDLWARTAHSVVESFRSEVPPGVALETIFDQSLYTEERLATLVGNLVAGALIVVIILFFMMGARSALIVASALPLTVAMVLGQLAVLGVPLHQTSVTGLIIALGLLIDNAIVVVDDYNACVRAGAATAAAVSRAVRELFVPLLASTLTTVFAFLPIVLMPGPAGEFVGPISIGVGLSVSSSFLLSMTVIPALAGYFTPSARRTRPYHWWREGYSNQRLAQLYRRSLDAVLRRPSLGVAVSCALPLFGFVVSATFVEQFFPPNDRNQFQIQLVLPPSASLAETEKNVHRVRQILHAHDEVVESHWFLGEGSPRVFYNVFTFQEGVSSFAGAFVTTKSAAATERLLPGLQRELSRALPNAMVMALPFEQGPPFEAPIEVRIAGPDIEELRRLGEGVRGILAETKRVTYTHAHLAGGEPKLMVVANEDEAKLAGLQLVDIAGQLNANLEGAVGGTVIEATEEIPVRVQIAPAQRADLAAIASKYVLPAGMPPVPAGATFGGVPLNALSDLELVPEVAGITRRGGERTNTVQAYLEPYAMIAESLEDFRRRLRAAGFTLPPGYRLELGGESEERSEAIGNLLAFALPLFVVMAGTVILSLNSFRMAGIVGIVAFLSIGLALMGVWVFGHPMGFLAIVGAMGLVGLAINGGIVVLSVLRADARACAGDAEAIREIVVGATRHILGTTLTTIGGFLPLIVFGGRFWPPMATAIAGGVGGSAVLALYLVPSMFVWMARRERRRDGARISSEGFSWQNTAG